MVSLSVFGEDLRSKALSALLFTAATLTILGCSRIPGRPSPGPEVVRPEQVLDFRTLYKTNCSACHGEDGRQGAAISLANPAYLAFVGEDNLRRITAAGVPGKLMPPFAQSSGGSLTDQQVTVIAQGIMQQWGKPNLFAGQTVPPYTSTLTADPTHGQQAFQISCSRCHGQNGEGVSDNKTNATKVGSIVDASYLDLISDQALRSIIIAGRPDQGMPDWRSDTAQPLTDQQVTDIVAWLASKRTPNPGQPYPVAPQAH